MALNTEKRTDAKTRTILLKGETYERLDRYKAKVIGKKGTSKITFDDVINFLLNQIDDE